MDYKLYYWEAPFRGNFVELILAEAKANYERHDPTEIYPEKSLKISHPGMAPPYLYDCKNKKYLAQMPAILMYLGQKHDYLPKKPETLALALKTILDCNDVLMEITNYHGMEMWTRKKWKEFRSDRLARWMQIFEKTGRLHGLQVNQGFLLGSRISVADLASCALFGTLMHCFPTLTKDLKKNSPRIAGLCQRIEARSSIKTFLETQRRELGQVYCGGQIERSLREMLE